MKGNGHLCSTLPHREGFLPSANVFSEHAVAYPRHAAGQLFARQDTKGGSRFGRRVAGNIEKAGNTNTAVRNWYGDVADFIDEPCAEHGAVEPPSALEHQLAQMKSVAELPKGHLQVDFLLPSEEVGNAGGLEVCQVIVAHAISDEQNNVIAIHFVLLEAQNTFGIHADCQSFGIFVGDVVTTNDRLLGARELHIAAGKFLHRGRPHEPGTNAKAGSGGLEERGALFATGQLAPATAEDFAVDGRAHVADHVGFHSFPRSSNASARICDKLC